MDAFTQTEFGQLPSDWTVERFDALFSVQQGKQVSKRNRVGENQRRFLRTKNVLWGRLHLTDLDEMHFTETEERRLALRSGDLLICEGGDIGRTAIWQNGIERCYYQNHLHRARLRNATRADAQFVLFWLWYAFEVGSVYFGRGNVTTIPNLSQSKLCELPLPVPPSREQRKIAGVLRLVQKAIEQQERLLSLTAEFKKTLLHKICTQGLRNESQKQTQIGLVPESWTELPLKESGEVVYGIQAAVASNVKPVGTKILTNKNLTLDGKIDLESINYFALKAKRHYSTLLRKGDLLFNWRSGSKEHVGKTAYFNLDGDYTHSSFILRIRPHDLVTGRYLYHYLNFLRQTGFFVRRQTFAVNAKFNKTALNDLPVYLPGKTERAEIVTVLDACDAKLRTIERKSAALKELFSSLLHRLMTAQIRVHDLNLSDLNHDERQLLSHDRRG